MVRNQADNRQSMPGVSASRNAHRSSRAHATTLTARPRRSRNDHLCYNESSEHENSDSSLSNPYSPDEGDAESEVEQDGDAISKPRSHRARNTELIDDAPSRTCSRRSTRHTGASRTTSLVDLATDLRRTKTTPRGQTRKRSQPAKSKTRSLKKRRVSVEVEPIPPGVIPPWTSPQIPYGAWTDIFYYAAIAGNDSLDVNWLISTATTCRTFSEAALTAIYRSPPLTTTGKAKRFAALLDRPPSETRFNYRTKIETLYLDVQIVPQLLLPKILHVLPRLKEVVLFTASDQPPYRQLNHPVRWYYTEDIFYALKPSFERPESLRISDENKMEYTTLKSWEWSGSLLGGAVGTMKDVGRIHCDPSFAHLTKLSFTNLQVPSLWKLGWKGATEERELELYNEDESVIKSIAEAISQLKSLQHLVFESSTIMNDRLLPLLPKGLRHLSLINCWEIKSDEFMPFLHSHGRHLRSLSLLHNQSLDLVFLTTLADSCPKLEQLYMNLSYFHHHDSISMTNNDADPLYDQVLLPHQKPEWPSSLRIIDFEYIRHWSVETAEMFLGSILDSAAALPDLRHLAVKTMLNIPWKARANMRHEWRRKLDRVFLRPFEPPRKHFSMRETQDGEVSQVLDKKKKPKRLSDGPTRRSDRLAAHVSDSESRYSTNSKGLRSSHGRPTYAEPETDENEFDTDEEGSIQSPMSDRPGQEVEGTDEGSEGQTKRLTAPVIQGRCTTVSIVFDNQKPTELQYGMEDFMDDDRAESDEEWNGDPEEDDDAVFVWR
ncbi:hypothetical protein NW768_008883 [Fusarium equiseti]|uniref:F-box protein n=1 Tax=Fusarium equiseti TaxID=61235 RepID=A0ABQ8R5M4_FUSEQ|nr:hypothetical protein NW768_008883 [Fusarium equiseti]